MWNYRIVTWIQKPTKKQKELGHQDTRLFSIKEVYYYDDKKPNSYTDTKEPFLWDNTEDLYGTYGLMGKALSKAILDLDRLVEGEYQEYKTDDK